MKNKIKSQKTYVNGLHMQGCLNLSFKVCYISCQTVKMFLVTFWPYYAKHTAGVIKFAVEHSCSCYMQIRNQENTVHTHIF